MHGASRMRGMYGYFARNMTGKKGQQGFTLIELLVVVTILGVLAAIVTLSLVGLTSNAQAKACQQEYRTVQSAIDAYMAQNNVDTVPAADGLNGDIYPTGTADMTKPVLLYNANSTPTYLRNSPTVYAYMWDTTGRISKIFQNGTGPAVPSGCVASGG